MYYKTDCNRRKPKILQELTYSTFTAFTALEGRGHDSFSRGHKVLLGLPCVGGCYYLAAILSSVFPGCKHDLNWDPRDRIQGIHENPQSHTFCKTVDQEVFGQTLGTLADIGED